MYKVLLSLFIFISIPQNQAEEFIDDINRLAVFKTALEDMFQEMLYQKLITTRHEKGYISNVEHDRIENLLFRYLILRTSLWEIIDRYRDYNTLYDDPEANMKAFVIGYNAALTLYRYSGILVTTHMEDKQIINKLNESYYRSGIPEGTFAKLFSSLTNPDNLQDFAIARELYSEELHTPGTPLNHLLDNPDLSPLLDELDSLHQTHVLLRDKILNHFVLLTPELTNKLRHGKIRKSVKMRIDRLGGRFQVLKALVFTKVGRLKSPSSLAIRFSERQKQVVYSQLKPGDIILTYSEGYMSNIFLPGTFKHGIIFAGIRSEWKEKDLGKLQLEDQKSSMIQPEDDIIEAVSEGVISNSMDNILEDHINRLLILRPIIDLNNVSEALRTAHSFLGNGYDFAFDFNDASFQVCTEIIYRSYNGIEDIQFELTKRAGVMTLSADDILHFALESGQMEFILLAVEEKKSPGEAVLLARKDAVSMLRGMIK